ncbi:MAG: DUF72 domain-containing protein [Deltaproteobacteria bacterium]|nr:DUF72 domain-containing protein [Deltaproteobacteria bacterium]MBW1847917.1 DUF72 domain-containing protein [Deltaproteobacteria bacterium]MBW2365550.1 DUF72 domain-containing protein [Deltaproteobacteria bacterium]
MLRFYARRFPTTELNYTWYQMPRAGTVKRQLSLVPSDFMFAVKLTRTLTHEIDPQRWQIEASAYRNGIVPLLQARQLAAVLIQLPPYFNRTPSNRKYLASLLNKLHGLPLAVEFRHLSWANDRVFDELKQRQVTLVSVDEPDLPGLFPALDMLTNTDLFYVRFHGRNAKGWRSGNLQHQFDYNYTEDELSEWIESKIMPMAGEADRGMIFFNNHVSGQAAQNAATLIDLLKRQGLEVAGHA